MRKLIGSSLVFLFSMVFLSLAPNVEAGAAKALYAKKGTEGGGHIAEGIKHYDQGHWGVAEEHFREAVKANENLAEAHYDLALALDKLGRHKEATQHFKKALDLAPDNPKIAESKILKAHLGM